MNLNTRKQAFINLGRFFLNYTSTSESLNQEELLSKQFDEAIFKAGQHNSWFTKDNIYFSLKTWGKTLTSNTFQTWTSSYISSKTQKTIAVIGQKNIPLTNFPDFLSILTSGNKVLIKQDPKNQHLLPFISKFLITGNPEFKNLIEFSDKKIGQFDAILATGNSTSVEYYKRYFSHKPNLIRKVKNSVAILEGTEKEEDLKPLGEDIFRFFGLSEHNVSKLFVPKDYDFESFFKAIYAQNPIINHHKYASNYDYNKTVYLMSEFKLLDNGFVILKKDTQYNSPVACLYYETYENEESLKKKLAQDSHVIKNIISDKKNFGHLSFGEVHQQNLPNHPNNTNTLKFLSKL